MSDADDYRSRSAQCFRLAATASTPLQRTVLLNAASSWMTLANQADRDRAWRDLQDTGEHGRRAAG
jgi:hypothetical protein